MNNQGVTLRTAVDFAAKAGAILAGVYVIALAALLLADLRSYGARLGGLEQYLVKQSQVFAAQQKTVADLAAKAGVALAQVPEQPEAARKK